MDKEQEKRIKNIDDHLDYLEKYVNEWLKWNSGNKMTVKERSESKEQQDNDFLIQLKLIFDEIEKILENDPKTELLNPIIIGKYIDAFETISIFVLDPDKKIKEYYNERLIKLFKKIKLNNELSNSEREIINYQTFVYLCFELKLIKEKYDRKIQEHEIRQLYEKSEHPIFEKLKLRNPIKETTDIYSIVRKYVTRDKKIAVLDRVKTIIKRHKLKSE